MAQQVRQCLVIGQIVDRHDLEIVGIALKQRLEALAPDPPEAVDRNACHRLISFINATHNAEPAANSAPLPSVRGYYSTPRGDAIRRSVYNQLRVSQSLVSH